jgi:hypothetical protein
MGSTREGSRSPDMDERQTISALCAAGDLDGVKALYNDNETFRKPNRLYYGLASAARRKHFDIVRFCLEHGAVVDEDIADDAAEIGSIPIFELFLEYGWDINYSPGGHGGTVLPCVFAP